MLIALILGAEPGSPLAAQLYEGFYELGPFGMAWNMGQRQHDAYAKLHGLLREALLARRTDPSVISPQLPSGSYRG